MISEFYKKNIVVTGAAQGIGEQVAIKLRDLGANVIGWDQKYENKDNPNSLKTDVSSISDVKLSYEISRNQFGDVNFLVCAAGILRMSSVLKMGIEDWEQTLAVNCTGILNCCQVVAAPMCQLKRGSIVVVGSNANTTPRMGMGAYAASKAAALQLVRTLGLELAEYGVRCNLVSPGSTDTEMQREFWHKFSDGHEAAKDKVINGSLDQHRLGIPLGRIATPGDVANSVLFMLSEQSRHITMHNLVIDGGATLGVQ